MTKEENKRMVRFLFLTIIILDVLDGLGLQPLPRRIIKKIYSLKRDFDIIPTNVFNSLPKDEALVHADIQLQFSIKFDEFYENFLKENNLSDEGKS